MRWRRQRMCQCCDQPSVGRIKTFTGTYQLCRKHYEAISIVLLKALRKPTTEGTQP